MERPKDSFVLRIINIPIPYLISGEPTIGHKCFSCGKKINIDKYHFKLCYDCRAFLSRLQLRGQKLSLSDKHDY